MVAGEFDECWQWYRGYLSCSGGLEKLGLSGKCHMYGNICTVQVWDGSGLGSPEARLRWLEWKAVVAGRRRLNHIRYDSYDFNIYIISFK